MKITKRYCDVCTKEIINYDPDIRTSHQHGEDYRPLYVLLNEKYKIEHICWNCIIDIAANIEAKMKTLKEAKEIKDEHI